MSNSKTTNAAIELEVSRSGFSTPAEIMKAIGIDYSTLCDAIDGCSIRGLYRGSSWGYVTRW